MKTEKESQKKAKIREIEFAKVRAFVDIAMTEERFFAYTITPYTSKQNENIVATVSITIRKELGLFVALEKMSDDVAKGMESIASLCKILAKLCVNNSGNTLEMRRLCNSALKTIREPFWYDMYYREDYYKPLSRLSFSDMEYIGGGYSILRHLVTQEEFMSVLGYNLSTFPFDTDPVDNVSYIDAMRYCNVLSELEDREPVYALNGEISADKWEDMILSDEGTQFYYNKNADGFRLPCEIEMNYLKDRDRTISEHIAVYSKDTDCFLPSCSYAQGENESRVSFVDDGYRGLSFRIVAKFCV